MHSEQLTNTSPKESFTIADILKSIHRVSEKNIHSYYWLQVEE